jgi:hypothetical protein
VGLRFTSSKPDVAHDWFLATAGPVSYIKSIVCFVLQADQGQAGKLESVEAFHEEIQQRGAVMQMKPDRLLLLFTPKE